jgi:Zn-dependent protease
VDVANIVDIVAIVLALFFAIIGHEIMHGRMALYYGDNTAKDEGRLSINPIGHIDPIGTIVVPALLYISSAGFIFGWAKPVPINMSKVFQKGGHLAGINVALAGIYYNFFIAILATIALNIIQPDQNGIASIFLLKFLLYMVVYNIILGTFNLLPIPPLDGSKALMFILAKLNFQTLVDYIQKIERYGMIILIIIIATPLSRYIFEPIQFLIKFFLSI